MGYQFTGCVPKLKIREERELQDIALNAIDEQIHFALFVKNGSVTLSWQQIEARNTKLVS